MSHYPCRGDTTRLRNHCGVYFTHNYKYNYVFSPSKIRGREYERVISLWYVFHIQTNIMVFSKEMNEKYDKRSLQDGF